MQATGKYKFVYEALFFGIFKDIDSGYGNYFVGDDCCM